MRALLTITAVFEALTGLALAIDPALVVAILLGARLTEPPAFLLGRLAGAALITIAYGCWLSRDSALATIMVKAVAAYNVFSILLLSYAALQQLSGPGLWPAAVLHAVLLFWCVSVLRKPARTTA